MLCATPDIVGENPSNTPAVPRCSVIADESLDGRRYKRCDGWSGKRPGAARCMYPHCLSPFC